MLDTFRNDLRFLTMLPWAEVLPSKGLLRLNRAWCPDCFEEWHQNGKVAYDPLMWSLEVVTTCPYHKRRLRQACPKCGANLPYLAPQARPGYCSRCFCWLGQVSKTDEPLTDDELKWQEWVTEVVGEMIASAPKLPELPCRINVAETISAYVEIISGGNATEFARELQEVNIPISKWSVWDWKSGKQLPQLGTLLKLCYYLGTKPLSFLQGKVNRSNYPQEIPFELVTVPHPECYRSFNMEKLRLALEAVLTGDEYPPLSMAEVARRLQHDHTHLIKLFPDLCYLISKRYRDYQRYQSEQRKQSVRDEVRQATLRVHAEGKYPSRRQVRALLSNSNLMRLPEALEAWKDTLRELGWNKEV